ncbi:MAG: citrate lyase acyl carrier protein [Planctomycetes bacterium]|nr:citrate lyase acyl carrier protein [Planctomycetota bacterium]
MSVVHRAIAGTLESSDIFLEVFPHQGGIRIDLTSTVMQQFGPEIERVIRETLAAHGVTDILVKADDRGALDCVIRARVETALARAGREEAR